MLSKGSKVEGRVRFMETRSRGISALPDIEGVLSERIRSLKRSYSAHKGRLTRLYGELERAMSSLDNAAVQWKRNEESGYDNVTQMYERLMEMLSPAEQEDLREAYAAEGIRRNKYLLKYGQWLVSMGNPTTATTPSQKKDQATVPVSNVQVSNPL